MGQMCVGIASRGGSGAKVDRMRGVHDQMFLALAAEGGVGDAEQGQGFVTGATPVRPMPTSRSIRTGSGSSIPSSPFESARADMG
jgi:hypothetical protein